MLKALGVEWSIAARYLRARRKEGFISVITAFSLLGVALGVAALIVVMAVMNGFHKDLLSRILGFNGHVVVYPLQGGIASFDTLVSQAKTLPEVTEATPFIEGQVMVSANGKAMGGLVRGMRLSDLKRKPLIAGRLRGELEKFQGNASVILGSELAASLQVHMGDIVTVISPQVTATVMGPVPRIKNYTVVGTFEAGMYQYDSSTLFIPLEAAQLYFRYPDQVSALEIMIKDPHDAARVAGMLSKRLPGGPYRIVDWQVANGSFFNALQIERSVMFLILTLIIVVAAFNIISSLIMLVRDKHADIAILRTMGATRGMIMRIFIMCGATIGISGTVLGWVLGVSFAHNIEAIRRFLEGLTGTRLFDPVIYYLAQLPADVQSEDVVSVVLMAVCLSLLATLYPAWRASIINPAEALRYE